MKKPRVLVFSGYGLNCEEETKFGFEWVGALVDIVHINDIIAGLKKLSDYQILSFPGGFSYGDETGSGNAYANKIKHHLRDKLQNFLKKDGLVIGICNGFQILVNLGLFPESALLHNASARFVARWVDLRVENDTPWLKNLKEFSLPIAHGEGNFYAPEKTLEEMKRKKLIALTYAKGEISAFENLPVNPTGTLENIAGITDESKKILGLMPHPERGMFFTQLPHWTYLKEKYKREGKAIPESGPGLQIFKNGVEYFS